MICYVYMENLFYFAPNNKGKKLCLKKKFIWNTF